MTYKSALKIVVDAALAHANGHEHGLRIIEAARKVLKMYEPKSNLDHNEKREGDAEETAETDFANHTDTCG